VSVALIVRTTPPLPLLATQEGAEPVDSNIVVIDPIGSFDRAVPDA
jgi:hypothetical protein